jgi:hypothetical protein
MGSHKNRICILSSLEAAEYSEKGIIPECLNHEHVSRNTARHMTSEFLYSKTIGEGITAHLQNNYEYDWVLPSAFTLKRIQAIVCRDPRHWSIRKSDGMDVHQLVRG